MVYYTDTPHWCDNPSCGHRLMHHGRTGCLRCDCQVVWYVVPTPNGRFEYRRRDLDTPHHWPVYTGPATLGLTPMGPAGDCSPWPRRTSVVPRRPRCEHTNAAGAQCRKRLGHRSPLHRYTTGTPEDTLPTYLGQPVWPGAHVGCSVTAAHAHLTGRVHYITEHHQPAPTPPREDTVHQPASSPPHRPEDDLPTYQGHTLWPGVHEGCTVDRVHWHDGANITVVSGGRAWTGPATGVHQMTLDTSTPTPLEDRYPERDVSWTPGGTVTWQPAVSPAGDHLQYTGGTPRQGGVPHTGGTPAQGGPDTGGVAAQGGTPPGPTGILPGHGTCPLTGGTCPTTHTLQQRAQRMANTAGVYWSQLPTPFQDSLVQWLTNLHSTIHPPTQPEASTTP